MTINSETIESRESGGSFESYFVTLDIQSFTNPESYDPTSTSGGGSKLVDTLLGVSVLGVEGGEARVAQYDHLGNEIHVVSHDGTSAASDVGEIRLRVDGNPSA